MSPEDEVSRAAARARGPIPAGAYRIVTLEADGRISVSESDSFERAAEHADDAASEGGPVSRVYDARLRVVYRGRHYVSKRLAADAAKKLGALPPGAFRVFVMDSDPAGRESVGATYRDFPAYKEAAAYADAQAALSDGDPPVALVLDADFKPVHVGIRRD